MAGRIIIAGGSGFIGTALSNYLSRRGYEIIILTRSKRKASESSAGAVKYVEWDAETSDGWLEYAENATAIVNLTGDNVGSWLWTKRKKQRMLDSRVNSGNAIEEAVAKSTSKPKVVIQASGIGIYGNTGDRAVDESATHGDRFFAKLAEQWEESVQDVPAEGVRLAIARFGVVLGKNGGFLEKITIPFRFFVGGYAGSGKQWISWIHIDDLVTIIEFIIENEKLNGIFNVASPNPVRSKDFFKTIGRVMHRPAIFRVPAFIIKMFLGEMGNELALSGQRIVPQKLLEANYDFKYENVETALKHVLN